MAIDTHVHFDLMGRGTGPEEIIRRAAAAGVDKMVAVGGTAAGNECAVRLARQFPDAVRAAVGFNRDAAGAEFDEKAFESLLASGAAAAIGETGLDFHRGCGTREAQIRLFKSMLAVARAYALPAVIHNRDADGDMESILTEHARLWPGPPARIGVCHCFTGSASLAERWVGLGFHVSFSGIVTFAKQASLLEAARGVPAERLLVETDSPFLSPEPVRGTENEPANLVYTIRALAAARNCQPERLAAVTARNADELFFKKAGA